MEHLHFLFAAYTAVWTMIFLYVWVTAKRTRRLEEQLQQLLQLVQKHDLNRRPTKPSASRESDEKVKTT